MKKDKNKDKDRLITVNGIPAAPLRFLWYIIKPYKWLFFLVVGLEIVSSTTYQTVPVFYKHIIDASAVGATKEVLFYLSLVPLGILATQLFHRLSFVVAKYPILSGRRDAYTKLSALTMQHSYTYFIDRQAGALMNKVSNVASAAETLYVEIIWSHVSTFITFLITVAILYDVNYLIALLFTSLIAVLVVINLYFVPRKRGLSKVSASAYSTLNGGIVDAYANHLVVRQFARETQETKSILNLAQNHYQASLKNWQYTDKTFLLNTAILFVFMVIIVFVSAYLWQMKEITTGELTLVVSLIMQISSLLIWLGRAFSNWAKAFGQMEEGLSEILVPIEIVDVDQASPLVTTVGNIVWNNVTFKYEANTVFDNFNLTITPGQRVGLVGPSGAGKTTFVSLLLRQYDVDSGSITIDGQNIAEVTQDSLRQAIAVVPQEPALFHRTIRENIAYGKPDATDEEIIEVAKKAQAHDFISALPLGYDTLVGERGVKLSGGQKQRVAIARAMLKDAPILVLDEATSALDSESEVEIQKALHVLMAGKTVVAIAHRLSTLREMDRIIVLEQGKIVEDGTHETLKEFGGTYQRLWEHQAGGFLVE